MPILLDTTVVTATRSPTSLRDVPAALSVVDQRAIQEGRPTVSLTEPLSRVPGVFVQDAGNQAQGPRIQIRGFGTRAAFGIREIKVLLDGMPETLPDGQTELGDVDLESIARIEVLRGPASSLYGNASGGVIQLFTEDAPDEPQIETRTLGGSYGLLKTSLKGGARAGDVGLFVQGSYFSIAGYREHATAYDGKINAKLRVALAAATSVTVLVNALDAPLAQDPGGLTRQQAAANPRQARDVNLLLDAGEAVQQGRLGAVLEHHAGAHALSAYGFTLYRDFDSRQPILPERGDGIVAFHRVSPGGGFRYDFTAPLLGFAQTLTVGFDGQGQSDDRRRFANVDGARGALGVSEQESVRGIGDVPARGGVRHRRRPALGRRALGRRPLRRRRRVSSRHATAARALLAVEPGRRRAVDGAAMAVGLRERRHRVPGADHDRAREPGRARVQPGDRAAASRPAGRSARARAAADAFEGGARRVRNGRATTSWCRSSRRRAVRRSATPAARAATASSSTVRRA